jgi:hypothetical protein
MYIKITFQEKFIPYKEVFLLSYVQLDNNLIMQPQCSSPGQQKRFIEYNPDPVHCKLITSFRHQK